MVARKYPSNSSTTNNEGVNFAKVHTSEEITVKMMTREALLLLPNGFRSHDIVFEKKNDDYEICI